MVTYAGEEIERDYFARFGDQRGGKEWGTYNFTWFNGVGDWTPIDTDTTGWDEDDFEEYRQELEHELVHTMLENPNSNLYEAIENNLTEGDEEHYITSYQVRNEDGDVQKLDFYISWDEPSEVRQKIQYYDKEPLHRLEFLAEKKLPPVEKAIDSGIASGATMEGLDLALGAEDDDPYGAKWEALRKSKRYRDKAAITGKKAYDRFAKIIAEKKLEAEEPSAYEFVKREIIKASPITESEVNRFLDKLANVPMSYLKEARSEALKLQDEMAVGILTMAINRRSFREEWASEDTEELRDNFAQLKAKNPELAREIEFSVKNEGELPEDKIKQAGVDLDMIEAWYDLVSSGDDPNLVPYESCATCEGEGIIITNYYPATRFDPADADFIDCEECIEGEYDPAYYMDKEGQYYAESFKAETNGDRQLEESVKRTKMSMIRTGLAITTFGIVLWNLWTNKKQEKQIDDIMDVV